MNVPPKGNMQVSPLATASPDSAHYSLRLFVTGSTPKSVRAIANIKKICETYLTGRYTLEVVDIYQQPRLARQEQIIATPTLIKERPLPVRKFIGDLSNTRRILFAFHLLPSFESGEVHGEI